MFLVELLILYTFLKTEFELSAESEDLDIGYGWCKSDGKFPANICKTRRYSSCDFRR